MLNKGEAANKLTPNLASGNQLGGRNISKQSSVAAAKNGVRSVTTLDLAVLNLDK